MVKRTTAVVAVAAFSVTAVALAATSFSDVPADHWAADAVMWANDNGIMTGPGDMPGKFDPNGSVNRAQLAVVSQRLYDKIMADMNTAEEFPVMEETAGAEKADVMEDDVAAWQDGDGTWHDRFGAQLRIGTENLERTADGRSWGAVEDRTWVGTDAYDYKFDKDWNLMMSMDNGETWVAADKWPGNYGYSYMRAEDGSVKWMSDWMEAEFNMWHDKNEFVIRVANDKVEWLKESGTEPGTDVWEELKDWTWVGTDGNTYKFDENFTLYVTTDEGKTWGETDMWPGMGGTWYKLDSEKVLWYIAG